MDAITESEQFAYDLFSATFFKLWSYLNPIIPDKKFGKELCDILLKFQNNLLIISVKDISVNKEKPKEVYTERWIKKAVDESIKQIYGAENYLKKNGTFTVKAINKENVSITEIETLDIYRIAVAFGSEGEFPIPLCVANESFVHILTEESIRIILKELDTVSDLIDYLKKKEQFILGSTQFTCMGGEKQLVAYFLMNERIFPDPEGAIVVFDDNHYDGLSNKPEFLAKKKQDIPSYDIDKMITFFSTCLKDEVLLFDNNLSDVQKGLAFLAAMTRFERRLYANSIFNVIERSPKDKMHAKMSTQTISKGLVFVILGAPHKLDRDHRRAFLEARIHVAAGLAWNDNPNNSFFVVGLATELLDDNYEDRSYDLAIKEVTSWSDDEQTKMDELQQRFGIWANSTISHRHEDEYPQ